MLYYSIPTHRHVWIGYQHRLWWQKSVSFTDCIAKSTVTFQFSALCRAKTFPGFSGKIFWIYLSSFHVCRQCSPVQIKYVSFADRIRVSQILRLDPDHNLRDSVTRFSPCFSHDCNLLVDIFASAKNPFYQWVRPRCVIDNENFFMTPCRHSSLFFIKCRVCFN